MPDVSQTKLVVPHSGCHEIPPSLSVFLLFSTFILLHTKYHILERHIYNHGFHTFFLFVSHNILGIYQKSTKDSIHVVSSTVCFSLSLLSTLSTKSTKITLVPCWECSASAKYLDWSWCLLQARLQCAEPCFHWLRVAFSEYASHLLIDCVGCRLLTWPLRTIGNMSPTSTPPDPGLPSLLTPTPWES